MFIGDDYLGQIVTKLKITLFLLHINERDGKWGHN